MQPGRQRIQPHPPRQVHQLLALLRPGHLNELCRRSCHSHPAHAICLATSAVSHATNFSARNLPPRLSVRFLLSNKPRHGRSLTSYRSCVFGLVRLGTMIKEKNSLDATWALSGVAIWSTAEPCLGITAACLPVLRPLFTSAISVVTGKNTKASSLSHSGNSQNPRSYKLRYGRPEGEDSVQLSDRAADVDVEAYVARESNESQQQVLPYQGVQVKTETHWTFTSR